MKSLTNDPFAIFHRVGEIRDRNFENPRYRASGLNLAVAAIILWNNVYLKRAVEEQRSRGEIIPDELLAHVAPLGWEHIAFNGDYVWPTPRSRDCARRAIASRSDGTLRCRRRG